MTRGRKPKPTELKRRLGNPGKRALVVSGNVIPLRPAIELPPYPDGLSIEARRLWQRAWDAGIIWLSPISDIDSVEQACRLLDGVTAARERYLATREPADARAWVALNGELRSALAALGFDPTARSRLGVAEVKAASAIDKLIERRRERGTKLAAPVADSGNR